MRGSRAPARGKLPRTPTFARTVVDVYVGSPIKQRLPCNPRGQHCFQLVPRLLRPHGVIQDGFALRPPPGKRVPDRGEMSQFTQVSKLRSEPKRIALQVECTTTTGVKAGSRTNFTDRCHSLRPNR